MAHYLLMFIHLMLVFYPWYIRLVLVMLGEQLCQTQAPAARLGHPCSSREIKLLLFSSAGVQSQPFTHNAETQKRSTTSYGVKQALLSTPSAPFSLKCPSLLWCSSTALTSSGGKKDCKQSSRTDGLSPSRSAN